MIELYNPEKHEKHLIALLQAHKMNAQFAFDVPYIGYIAYCGQLPAALGFVRSMEGGLGLMESCITNPELNSEQRHIAYEAVTQKLYIVAKESGLTKLFAFSTDEGTIERALRHGFTLQPHSLISKEL